MVSPFFLVISSVVSLTLMVFSAITVALLFPTVMLRVSLVFTRTVRKVVELRSLATRRVTSFEPLLSLSVSCCYRCCTTIRVMSVCLTDVTLTALSKN